MQQVINKNDGNEECDLESKVFDFVSEKNVTKLRLKTISEKHGKICGNMGITEPKIFHSRINLVPGNFGKLLKSYQYALQNGPAKKVVSIAFQNGKQKPTFVTNFMLFAQNAQFIHFFCTIRSLLF